MTEWLQSVSSMLSFVRLVVTKETKVMVPVLFRKLILKPARSKRDCPVSPGSEGVQAITLWGDWAEFGV